MHRLYTNFRWGFSGEPMSMLVDGGRVVFRGSQEGGSGETIDLGGRYLLPAFNDAHCHILPTGLDLQKLHLGHCSTPEEVLDAVRDRQASIGDGDWLMAVHYDQTKFPGAQHLTRNELDAISSTRPILLRHVNGHASVANSAALGAAGVNEETPDPEGGTYVRDESGRLTGVLLELAHESVTSAAPSPTLDGMVEAILAASEKMHALGITCASDMMTGRYDLDLELQAYRIASQRSPVRFRLYLQWAKVFGRRAVAADRLASLTSAYDEERCRVAGIKIFADGAIGSATAGIYGHFLTNTSPTGDTDGILNYSPDRLKEMVRTAHEAGYQVAIHSIGDYSTDLVMDAYEALDAPSRHRIEHAMLLSDSQIERMHRLGIHCTMQPEFLHHFGHSYLKQLGPDRASKLKRARSVKDAGIPLSFSSDRPIVAGDPWDGILTASNRHHPFDPGENVTRAEAIEAYTRMSSHANGEPNLMGALEPGQLADFQLYEEDPLTAARPQPITVELPREAQIANR